MRTRNLLSPLIITGLLGLSAIHPQAQDFPEGFQSYRQNLSNGPLVLGYGVPPIALGPNGVSPFYGYGDSGYAYDAAGNAYFTGRRSARNNSLFASYGPNAIPRASDAIEASRDSHKRLTLSWQGDTRLVSRIRFALLDKGRQPLTQRTITELPAETTFTPSKKAEYYQVVVEYVNGTTNSVVSPL